MSALPENELPIGQSYNEHQLERLQALSSKKFFALRFPKDFEIDFLNYASVRFYKQVRTVSLFILIGLIGFALLDQYLGQGRENLISILEVQYISPVIGVILLILFMQGLNRRYNLFLFIFVFLLGIGALSLLQMSAPNLDFVYFIAILLLQIISFIFMRLYFQAVIPCVLTIFLAHGMVFLAIDLFVRSHPTAFLCFYFITSICALLSNYAIEWYARKNYIDNRTLLFQAENLGMINFRMQNMSEMDGLTGIYNRLKFDETLCAEWNRTKRSEDAISLVMIDLDAFRQYNKDYGHALGDALLKKIGIMLRQFSRRASDLAARFSGDVFALLLPGTQVHEACSIAEWIKEKVSELNIAYQDSGSEKKVTVSIGVASCYPVNENGSEYEVLLNRADLALHTAKQNGRNSVEVYHV